MPAPPATVNRLATIAADINLQAGEGTPSGTAILPGSTKAAFHASDEQPAMGTAGKGFAGNSLAAAEAVQLDKLQIFLGSDDENILSPSSALTIISPASEKLSPGSEATFWSFSDVETRGDQARSPANRVFGLTRGPEHSLGFFLDYDKAGLSTGAK